MADDIKQLDNDIGEESAKKKKTKKKGYFLKEEEEAFRQYLVCENEVEKNILFEKKIYPSLCKMVESLIRRYHLFSVDDKYEDTFHDTLSFLATKIHNFDPNKKCKAYSYCGTVCKNYLILKRAQSQRKRDRFLSYEMKYPNGDRDDVSDEVYSENPLHKKLIKKSMDEITTMLETNRIGKRNLTENERKIGEALVEILNNWEDMIDDGGSRKFNKASLLYFIREYTLCNTSEIRNAMRIFKNAYLLIKENILDNEYKENIQTRT